MCGNAQIQNSNFINKVAVNLDKAFSNVCENQFQQVPVQWIIKGLEPYKLAFGSISCHRRLALSTGHHLAENHADAHFPAAGQEYSFVIAEEVFLASERNYVAVVIQLKCDQLRSEFPPDRISGVNGSVLFAANSIVHAVSLIEIISVNLVAGAEDMRQLMQKNVLQLCRMTRYVCAQKDSVRVVSCADECRGVKVKIGALLGINDSALSRNHTSNKA